MSKSTTNYKPLIMPPLFESKNTNLHVFKLLTWLNCPFQPAKSLTVRFSWTLMSLVYPHLQKATLLLQSLYYFFFYFFTIEFSYNMLNTSLQSGKKLYIYSVWLPQLVFVLFEMIIPSLFLSDFFFTISTSPIPYVTLHNFCLTF